MKNVNLTKFIFLAICAVLVCLLSACVLDEEPLEEIYYSVTYSAEKGGRIEGNAEQRVKAGENAEEVTAVPDEGYDFVKWSDGLTTATRRDNEVASSFTVTAEFEKQTFTLQYFAGEGGIITGEATYQTVPFGGIASKVTATPNRGYQFVQWSDGIKTASRQDKDIKMDITVTAEFAKKEYTVAYHAGEGGTIMGKTNQLVKYGEYSETVMAVPAYGYQFVQWSDGISTAIRQDEVLFAFTVNAIFEKKTYTVQYFAGEGGSISGNSKQQVKFGDDAEAVHALEDAKNHYYFVGWSDGVMTKERQDKNISSDITVTALFELISYNLRYIAGKGGTIIGNTDQMIMRGKDAEEVTAVPDKGYVFGGWSDVNTNATRQDLSVIESFEIIAYFEPIEKTFSYDYGIASGTLQSTGITINRNDLLNLQFVVPEHNGYTFCGWYADKDYTLKVADGDGRYMLGNYGLTLETDTLYARWKKDGEEDECIVHKILLVFIQELSAQLPLRGSTSREKVQVDYTMTSIERQFCAYLPSIMSRRLNEWFKGTNIRFEVDSYYTLLTVGQDAFQNIGDEASAEDIVEMGPLNGKYHNVIAVQGMHDYNYLIHSVSGRAGSKYGTVFLDSVLRYYVRHRELLLELENWKNGDVTLFEETCLHEFAHTCEQYFNYEIFYGEEFLEYHTFYYYYPGSDLSSGIEATRIYLLGEAEFEGKKSAFLWKYWRNELKVPVHYVTKSGRGKIVEVGASEREPYVSKNIPYGSAITVKAVPEENYRFLMWSDGVMTAVRTDTDIISRLDIKAIFVERVGVKFVPETGDGYWGGGKIVVIGESEDPDIDYVDRDVPYGSSITVEAIPDEGYRFARWMDGVKTARRTDTVTSFLEVVAVFVKV